MGQGDAVVHIYINNLAQVQIELPPITEQNAIASILSDMDSEIAGVGTASGQNPRHQAGDDAATSYGAGAVV